MTTTAKLLKDMETNIDEVIGRILKDLSIELGDEFDQNFERQAFFSEGWQRRRSGARAADAPLLIQSGDLRRSIMSRTTENSIVFYTDLPYARIHNDGGEIVVTERMKMFFRYKFYASCKDWKRKKFVSGRGDTDKARRKLSDGGFYAMTKDIPLSEEAAFWRMMALMKVGKTIKIPRRRFLGTSPEVERIVRETIERNVSEYFKIDFSILER